MTRRSGKEGRANGSEIIPFRKRGLLALKGEVSSIFRKGTKDGGRPESRLLLHRMGRKHFFFGNTKGRSGKETGNLQGKKMMLYPSKDQSVGGSRSFLWEYPLKGATKASNQ